VEGKEGIWLGFVGLVYGKEGLWQGNGTTPVVYLGRVGAPFFLCRQLCFKVHTHTQKKKCVVRECVIKYQVEKGGHFKFV